MFYTVRPRYNEHALLTVNWLISWEISPCVVVFAVIILERDIVLRLISVYSFLHFYLQVQ
jgi:hypothetical protein